ncbi:MAG: FtsX-like permease family protein [Acidobacteria bacterium]|nr:FtsX-like permease family protein [Acidobacteriota bacterium]
MAAPRLLRRIAKRLVRGREAPLILADMDELYRRDRARGLPGWRASWLYAVNTIGSSRSMRRSAGRGNGWGVSWLDLVVGARMLFRHPVITLIGGLGIAVTIAIGVASFTFFYTNLYPTIPLEEGHRLVGLENWDVEINNESRQQLHDYHEWRAAMRTVSEFAAFRPVSADIIGGSSVERIRIAQMTASGFEMARVAPVLGRYLVEADEAVGAVPVLVIGHGIWQSQFAGDPDVVGREVRLGRSTHTIVGVMPEGFGFPFAESYWAPLRLDPNEFERGEGPSIFIFGLLAEGATFEAAQAELAAIGDRASVEYPDTHAQLRARVHPYTYPLIDIQGIGLAEVGAFQVIVSLLLIVVGTNVAVLTYARTATRSTELSVRSALGASRRRLLSQFVAEALVFTVASAAVGLVAARYFIRESNRVMELDLTSAAPFWASYSLPPAAWVYTLFMIALTAVLIGALPALRATGRDLRDSLSDIGGGGSVAFGRTWSLLIVAQIAISVAGLPVAMSMGWTVVGSGATEPNFDSDEILSTRLWMQLDFPPLPDDEARAKYTGPYQGFVAELERRFESETNISAVTIAGTHPGGEPVRRLELDLAAPDGAETTLASARRAEIAVDFFAAFDTPVLDGREFDAGDLSAGMRPVVVNATFVDKILKGMPAVGHRLRYVGRDGVAESEEWREVIGVVADLHSNRADPDWVRPTVYEPVSIPDVGFPARLIVRAPGSAVSNGVGDIEAQLDGIATGLDPSLRLVGTRSLEQISQQETVAIRTTIIALVAVTLSVLLLSAAGVYAMMSFTVTSRTREIGIRSALGGRPGSILRTVFGASLKQMAAGVVLAVALAVALDGLADGGIVGEKGLALVPATALILIVVGVLAALGPARRGLRIEPTDALRSD